MTIPPRPTPARTDAARLVQAAEHYRMGNDLMTDVALPPSLRRLADLDVALVEQVIANVTDEYADALTWRDVDARKEQVA